MRHFAKHVTATPEWKILSRVARGAFFVGIVAWLALKIDAIGWREVLSSLPMTPWFYLIFLVRFFTLPLSEMLSFRLLFGREKPWVPVGVFLKKRIFNNTLIGYSGDIYFFMWAKDRLSFSKTQLALLLKDNAILSALAGLAAMCVLLFLFVDLENFDLVSLQLDERARWVIGATIIAVLAVPLFSALGGRVFVVTAKTAVAVLGIHLARIGAVTFLLALQWAVVLPEEPLRVWIFFLTMQMLISRLSFIPNRELLFMSAAMELSQVSVGPREQMAALMLASGALTQGLNLFFYVYVSIDQARSKGRRVA